jgi:hypothetical protein
MNGWVPHSVCYQSEFRSPKVVSRRSHCVCVCVCVYVCVILVRVCEILVRVCLLGGSGERSEWRTFFFFFSIFVHIPTARAYTRLTDSRRHTIATRICVEEREREDFKKSVYSYQLRERVGRERAILSPVGARHVDFFLFACE